MANFLGQDVGGTSTPWLDILEQYGLYEPLYYSRQNEWGNSPNQQRFFKNSYGDFFNQYQGLLGNQVRSGQDPTLRFNDFMGGMNFQDYYRRQPPAQRGQSTAQFAPSVRWI